MLPLVSVVMSTYNRAGMLEEAVNSVLNQTMNEYEFIIINDNSSDNTASILEKYKDKRIRIYNNNQNCGCTFNYHNAHNIANGKYIAHIDDDDISLPERLEKETQFLEKNSDIAMVGTFIETFGENKRPSWVFYTVPEEIDFVMNFYNPICHSSIMYRKSFFDKNLINYDINKICAQDYDLYKQILFCGGKIANIDEVLVKYRMHTNRLTDINSTRKIQINNAECIKYDLLSRYLDENQIKEVTALFSGFPFNSYNKDDVVSAVEIIEKGYKTHNIDIENVVNKIKADINNELYKF